MNYLKFLVIVQIAWAPASPLMRLRKLEEDAHELLTESFGFLREKHGISWKEKFSKNAERMEKNWTRGISNPKNACGSYEVRRLRKRREAEDLNKATCKKVDEITTGYADWADSHIGYCSGQRNKRIIFDRMKKWQQVLSAKLTRKGISCGQPVPEEKSRLPPGASTGSMPTTGGSATSIQPPVPFSPALPVGLKPPPPQRPSSMRAPPPMRRPPGFTNFGAPVVPTFANDVPIVESQSSAPIQPTGAIMAPSPANTMPMPPGGASGLPLPPSGAMSASPSARQLGGFSMPGGQNDQLNQPVPGGMSSSSFMPPPLGPNGFPMPPTFEGSQMVKRLSGSIMLPPAGRPPPAHMTPPPPVRPLRYGVRRRRPG